MSVRLFHGDHVYVVHGHDHTPGGETVHWVDIGVPPSDETALTVDSEDKTLRLDPDGWAELIEIVSMIKYSVATGQGTRMTELEDRKA